jgi:hypothetical protein
MEAFKRLKPNIKQPGYEVKTNVSKMAKVDRLTRFNDLSMIGQFAERFKLHPNEVFSSTDFDTVLVFLEMWKEESEYSERFNTIYNDLKK